MNDEMPRKSGAKSFLLTLLLVVGFVAVFALVFRSGLKPPPAPDLNKPFVEIEAAGWLNGPAPKASDLQGKVLVVDAWAHWCGPCRMAIPGLISLHKKYKDQGVVFIGLTDEGTDPVTLKKSEQFVEDLRIPWLNGYGAIKTFNELEINGIPQLWVVDRNNQIVLHERGFHPNGIHEIDRAIQHALSTPVVEKKPEP